MAGVVSRWLKHGRSVAGLAQLSAPGVRIRRLALELQGYDRLLTDHPRVVAGVEAVDITRTEVESRCWVGAAASRMLVIFLPFVFASAAGGAPGNRVLDTLASLGFATLFVSLVLMAVATRRRLTVHDLIGRTRVVAATKRSIEWQQDVRMVVPGTLDLTKRP